MFVYVFSSCFRLFRLSFYLIYLHHYIRLYQDSKVYNVEKEEICFERSRWKFDNRRLVASYQRNIQNRYCHCWYNFRSWKYQRIFAWNCVSVSSSGKFHLLAQFFLELLMKLKRQLYKDSIWCVFCQNLFLLWCFSWR